MPARRTARRLTRTMTHAISSSVDTITNISLTSYTENRPNKWIKTNITDLSNELLELRNKLKSNSLEAPEASTSRYEVLVNVNRRLYLDVEGIPFENESLIYELQTDLNKFLHEKDSKQCDKDLIFVITYNQSSANHIGRSYHLICTNYSMSFINMKGLIEEFVNTDGIKYKEYVDCSVYSKKRLFKLPYYIGITHENQGLDDNLSNFHNIVSNFTTNQDDVKNADYISNLVYAQNETEFMSYFVIQHTTNTKFLSMDYQTDASWSTSKISPPDGMIGGNRTVLKTLNMISAALLGTQRTMDCNEDEIIDNINMLYERIDKFSEITKIKIQEMHDYVEKNNGNYDKNVMVRYKSLIATIKNRYSKECK